MSKIQIAKSGLIENQDKSWYRYPNLNTVLMVEDTLKKHSDKPLKLSELKDILPRQVMHQTLKIILVYLWKSGKIIYGPKGVQWIYSEPEHLKKMFEDSMIMSDHKEYNKLFGYK